MNGFIYFPELSAGMCTAVHIVVCPNKETHQVDTRGADLLNRVARALSRCTCAFSFSILADGIVRVTFTDGKLLVCVNELIQMPATVRTWLEQYSLKEVK